MIATLSSNMDFALWAATKNHLKGEWIKVSDDDIASKSPVTDSFPPFPDKVADLTQLLIAHFNDDLGGLSPVAKTLHAQITCASLRICARCTWLTSCYSSLVGIAWSQQAHLGIAPTPLCDSSLLVAGNRAGCLTFLR